MARVSVYVPDELEAACRERLPGVNRSEVLQRALRALLGCEHSSAVCADCGEPVSISGAQAAALDGFYSALLAALEEPVIRGATAEGAARVAKEVARRWRVPAAERLPLPPPQQGRAACRSGPRAPRFRGAHDRAGDAGAEPWEGYSMSVTCVSTGRVVSTRHDLPAEDRPLMSSSVEELAGGEWEVSVVLWDGRPRRVATFTHPGEAVTACNIAARVLGMVP